MAPSRGPGCRTYNMMLHFLIGFSLKTSSIVQAIIGWHTRPKRLISRERLLNMKHHATCFNETGKVSFPDNSGLLTISLHISLQDLQTAAQATTCFRAGHVLSLASNLLITSRSNSGGRLAHLLFWITIGGSCNSCTEPCDFPRI